MHFAAFLDVGESVREPAKYYRNNVIGALSVLEAMAAESVDAFRLLVDLRDLRRADRDADRRDASAAADQQLRRVEAGGRAGAAAFRARRYGMQCGRAALLQRRGRRSRRRDRRGSLAGDSPDSARDRGGDRRPRPAGVRRRLPDAGRHLPARLHSRHRSRRRARQGARGASPRRRRPAPTISAPATRIRCAR